MILGGLLVASGASAQRSTTLPKVGFLGMDSKLQAPLAESFVKQFASLGWVDGRNVTIVYRWAESRFDRLPALARELVALNVDVIVTAAPPVVRAAHQATTSIPIVMLVHDPVGMGFAESLARPGRNITGVAFQDTELATKRLDYLRQALPGLSRLAVLWNKAGGGFEAVQAVQAAATPLGIQVLALEVQDPPDFTTAIAKAKAWNAGALAQLASPIITMHKGALLELLAANGLPATCERRDYVVEGCLMSYGANYPAMLGRLAYFVDRILKGAKAADLPIELPREFEFVVNEKTAKALGLALPPALLLQATEVIR